MIGQIIDGKAIAARVRGEVAQAALALRGRGITPALAVVLVGDDPASAVYVKNKTKAAREACAWIETEMRDKYALPIAQERFGEHRARGAQLRAQNSA